MAKKNKGSKQAPTPQPQVWERMPSVPKGDFPTPPEGWEPVPSFMVDRAMLRSWGFEVAGCSAGHDETPGMEFGMARHIAWLNNWTVQKSGPWTRKPVPTPDPETLAWGLAQKGL